MLGDFQSWLIALESRHLADLRFAEVTRALRALSSAYVERRGAIARGGALDSAGKRAAFAVFYAPLHFLTTREVVRALGTALPRMDLILDLGCGTGTAGAAWALETRAAALAWSGPRILGVDRHPWAVAEARWTYRALGLHGEAKRADAARVRLPQRDAGILAAFTVNELPKESRDALLPRLIEAADRGCCVLIIEPIARTVSPWWNEWSDAFTRTGGRADEWRFAADLPDLLRRLDRAAGLDHRELTARSLFLNCG